MARLPTNDYYPNVENEDFELSQKVVALDESKANTPFLISPQIAMQTKQYAELFIDSNSDIYKSNEEIKKLTNWRKPFDSGEEFFVPENRWVLETVNKPFHIEENKYKIEIPCDIFFRKNILPLNNIQADQSFGFVSRTLYQHIEDFDQEIDFESDDYLPKAFAWMIRWLPKNKCKLRFYTDEGIENTLFIKTPLYEIELDDTIVNVKVPFFLRKDLYQKMVYFKHDSLILYMEIEEIK
jgi:hypothetical protein